MTRTIFIADLHLSDHTSDLNKLFFRSLDEWQNDTDALYILGDFFDVWTGDDVLSDTAQSVATALKRFSSSVPVYFICGNRDFLLGQRFAALSGMILLPERYALSLYGRHYLIMHGDELCTDDITYLWFRRIIQSSVVRFLLLSLPKRWRQIIASGIRSSSMKKKQRPEAYTMSDATEQGIREVFMAQRAADILIHGHTHRPAIHQHEIGGKNIVRYVLPDWYDGTGGFLSVSPQGIQMHRLP